MVASASLVSTTSSVELGQELPGSMVQRNVAEVPAGTPVTPEVGLVGVVILAVPEKTDQEPVPAVGTFPASVKEPLSQFVWSVPALAVVGSSSPTP